MARKKGMQDALLPGCRASVTETTEGPKRPKTFNLQIGLFYPIIYGQASRAGIERPLRA
jgi:hypothetical protein